jgi:hypothetical protein
MDLVELAAVELTYTSLESFDFGADGQHTERWKEGWSANASAATCA